MSRHTRKRYEKIYTRRAREGFPPVSQVILHKNGTVTKRMERPLMWPALRRTWPLREPDKLSERILQAERKESVGFLERIKRFLRALVSYR